MKITDIKGIRLLGKPVGTEKKWEERKRIIFRNNPIYDDLAVLIDKANRNELSLAIFKPREIMDFVVEETERDWPKDKLSILKQKANQLSLFQSEEEVKKEFSVVNKLPYKFSYRFRDGQGKEATLMIEDWEIGALYWNCFKREKGDEKKAVELVKRKYWTEFRQKDIYLFLGTTKQFHGWAKNPFVIVGVFYPPLEKQPSLFEPSIQA
ncbi:MAG: hypothetical protein HZA01_02565 [Nitrospinae bacterium]|nr:hypothetical protein [Nitrospinota bacterium]